MTAFSMMQERDVLRQPYFLITLNGKIVPLEQHEKISEIVIEDSEEELDVARITILDTNDYFFVNNSDIVKDASVTIKLGHTKNFRTMINGVISMVEATFDNNGVATLIITVVDKGVTMTKERKTRKWEKMKISDVVSSIVAETGMFCNVIDTETILPQITQNDETDLTFINRLATELGYSFHCVSEGVYFFGYVDMNDPPIATLNYNQLDCSIISFSFNYESKGDTSAVNSDINSDTGETETREDDIESNETSTVPEISVATSNGEVKIVGSGEDFCEEVRKDFLE